MRGGKEMIKRMLCVLFVTVIFLGATLNSEEDIPRMGSVVNSTVDSECIIEPFC